jgi:NAD(P)-dependent dehydrogenase (short-subunit alcohol dehydrogenase family)
MADWQDRVVVITGGAGGIGLGIGGAFGRSGARVLLADIDEERLGGAVAELVDSGIDAVGVGCDVRSLDSMTSLRDQALERFGPVSVVCLNAGAPLPRRTVDVSASDWERVLGVNLFGVVHGVKAFLPVLEDQGEGHISATSSMSGLISFPPVVTYNVAKAGVIAYMETVARELRAAGSPVSVSVFCPAEVAAGAIENAMRLAQTEGYEPSTSELEAAEHAQASLLQDGMNPDKAGEILREGIEDGRFWIFTHPKWVEGVVAQKHSALATDGTLPDL